MAARKTAAETAIPRSPRAFWYHLGYYFTRSVRKLIFWVIFATVATTAFRLVRSAQAFGISDAEMARAFLEPFASILPIFFGILLFYAIVHGLLVTSTTHYYLTPQGILLETGWWTKRKVIVSYDQIQKMTIVANPYDRFLQSSYIYLDLIGGGLGISLEAIDAKAVGDLQKKLTSAATPRLTTQTTTTQRLVGNTQTARTIKPAVKTSAKRRTNTKKKSTASQTRKSRGARAVKGTTVTTGARS